MNTTRLFVHLWKAFPLIPAGVLALILLPHYAFGRDWSRQGLRAGAALQLVSGIALLALGLTQPELKGSLTLPLSHWAYGIVFRYEPVKLYFLGAFLIPLVFGVFRLHLIPTAYTRFIFLLYLAGASGLIVTGDIFNFFVFFEVMIMGAYILIAIPGDFGASIKYMLIGSVSSALFLGGTVVLYTSGAYFGFTFADNVTVLPTGNVRVAMLLFALAFFVKAAFFPASGWVASCHSAANSIVSAFLASFTIFSGIIGLYYFVLMPAERLNDTVFFALVRTVSLLTLPTAALFLFWEPKLKRAIAASTVFTIGIVGLLLSYRAYAIAFSYVLVHGFYKSLLFFVYGEMREKASAVSVQRLHFAAYLLGLFFTMGLFPSVPWFLKGEFLLAQTLYKSVFSISIGLLAGGFAKYRYRLVPGKRGTLYLSLSLALMVFLYGLLAAGHLGSGNGWILPPLPDLLLDVAAVALGVFLGGRVFRRFPHLQALDSRRVYADINRELLLILVLGLAAFVAVFAP